MSRHQKKTGPRFIQLFYWMLDTPAWGDLTALERSIYVELTRRYNGTNNGSIGYSARTAADEFKISKVTAAKALRSLERHGFIVCEKRGAFHCKIRHASEYRLTIYDSDVATNYQEKLPTKECMRWPEIQNTVKLQTTTGLVGLPNEQRSLTGSSNNRSDSKVTDTVRAIFAHSR
jgi:hypothetical protein